MVKKPKKIVPFPKQLKQGLTDEDRAELDRLRPTVAFSEEEYHLMRRVGYDSFALYMNLAFLCDPATGVVDDETYDSLRQHVRNEDLTVISRSNVRICLLELDGVGLVVFDRTTGTKRRPTLSVRLPLQVDDGAT